MARTSDSRADLERADKVYVCVCVCVCVNVCDRINFKNLGRNFKGLCNCEIHDNPLLSHGFRL